jgi:replicative DNA helicase
MISPFNEDPMVAENHLVAMMLAFPRAIHDVADIVEPEHFSDARLRSLFVATKESFGETGEHDIIGIARRAKGSGWSVAEIGELIRSAVTDTFAVQRANDVVMAWERRETIRTLKGALSESEMSTEDPAMFRQRLADRLRSVGVTRTGGVRPIRDIITEALQNIDRRMAGEKDPSGIRTGFYSLDKMTGGMRPGEVIILAARPGMGKSALAMNITEVVTVMNKLPTLFVSLEMSDDELIQRLLSGQADVQSTRVRKAKMSPDERTQLGETAARIAIDTPLVVDASPGLSIEKITATAMRLAARPEGLKFIVIDYLQLIEPSNRRDPRQEQVSLISRQLKHLARRLNVPILCLAQLNRESEKHNNRRPRKSDLRESGSLEQDADVVLLIHRESESLPESERAGLDQSAVLIVDKNRHGSTGDIYLRWIPSAVQFVEVST